MKLGKTQFFIFNFCFILALSQFSSLENNKKKALKAELEKMILVEGDSFIAGITSGIDISPTKRDTFLLVSGMRRQSKVASFYMSATEVTNKEWKDFYEDKGQQLGHSKAKSLFYPDSTLWLTEFPYSYNAPMAKNYFSNSKFDNYPIVGITWEQADAYCKWKENKINQLLQALGSEASVKVSLPTELEWEFAANNTIKEDKIRALSPYTWHINKEEKAMSFNFNIGQILDANNVVIKQYNDDGCLYTCGVGNYAPNDKGFYDMGGNVSEWVKDDGYTWSYISKTKSLQKLSTAREIDDYLSSLEDDSPIDDDLKQFYTLRLRHDQKVLQNTQTKLCKGGSWADGIIYSQIGVRQAIPKSKASTKIGFRYVIHCESPILQNYLPRKMWKPNS